MKILVIAADGNEANLPAIKQALDYLGTPYTVYMATQTRGGLTPDKLGTGSHGYYQGIILTNGQLLYHNGSCYVSAFTQQEWTNLRTYESQLGIRELSWYTYPTADFGYQTPTLIDTTSHPVTAMLTTVAQKTAFPYMHIDAAITIRDVYTYLAKPLTDGATTPFLSDADGNALAALRTYPDGRQVLSLTFDSNPNLMHNMVLSYGLINWLTNGLFLGERHVYMSVQIDDLFIEDSDWLVTTDCGTPVDDTGATYRLTGDDFQATINWQNAQRAHSVSAHTTLTWAFNGRGMTGIYDLDTLTPVARTHERQFYWVNHTYSHSNLDAVDYATAASEITQNSQMATGFTHFCALSMVTPDVSGLNNASFLQAAYDNGIRYLVSDTSQRGYNNPSPNAGIYNPYQPAILMLPRYPNNLFYNVSTPDGWVKEYNCIYANFWGRKLAYQEIVDKESDTLTAYLLKGDINPWMFHQPNLRAYDGTHTLLGDLLDLTLQKYARYYNLPIVNTTMDDLGSRVARRMQYNSAGVTAAVVSGVSITITAQQAVVVPVTGLPSEGAECYGGQNISYIHLNAGQSITLPLRE
jgi:hypothetical protein